MYAFTRHQVLQRRQGMTSGGLTIKELNDALDQLAATENRLNTLCMVDYRLPKVAVITQYTDISAHLMLEYEQGFAENFVFLRII